MTSSDLEGQLRLLTKCSATIALILLGFAPLVVHADAVGLELAPQEYQQSIASTKPQQGFIDVSNPSDSPVNVTTSVQGFRQIDSDGNLAYYDDAQLSAAIVPNLSSFTLGAREAVRVGFTVNSELLPSGGVYAVIFFRTVPSDQTSGNSYVSESAKVGTLLILNNGGVAPKGGSLSAKISHWQIGSGLSGSINYAVASGSVGLTPNLSTKAYPWGKKIQFTTGLVLPGANRNFALRRPGAFFGIVPLTITDAVTGRSVTTWVVAITGWYETLVALIVASIVAFCFRHWRRPRRIAEIIMHPMDGLSRRN